MPQTKCSKRLPERSRKLFFVISYFTRKRNRTNTSRKIGKVTFTAQIPANRKVALSVHTANEKKPLRSYRPK